ncbi:HTH-type transcriptional regulator MgrA [compost metagenome]
MDLGTGTLTPMITRMESNGWLRRRRSETDERKVHIHLEQKSFDEQQSITKAISEEILACDIGLEEYVQLMSELSKLQSKLKLRKQG